VKDKEEGIRDFRGEEKTKHESKKMKERKKGEKN
jgi:hypothetical protein